ncbi:MAG: DMT family transporter [Campylobacterota bacterium]
MKYYQQSAQNLGIVLMVIGVMLIPVTDAIAKYLSSFISVYEITWVRFLFQTGFIVLILFYKRYRLLQLKLSYIILGVTIAFSILFLFWGLKYLPLANNIAIFFVEPLILTLLSAIFLKEKISKTNLIVVAIGLIGTIIILRPNISLYGFNAIFPLLAAFFYALYLMFTKMFAKEGSLYSLQFWVNFFAMLTISSIVFISQEFNTKNFLQSIDADLWGWLILLGVITTLAHLSITKAFTFAPANKLASFQYLEIIGATILGWIFFNHVPDALTFIGASIVVGCGVYLALYNKKIKK